MLHHPHQPLLVGRSAAVRRMLLECERLAECPYPLLLRGETGTGKSLIAAHLHRLSARTGALVKASAPGIPVGLEASHLFGHVRGAFTDAYCDRIGLAEAAHLGSLLLDEFGVATGSLQQLLLQFLDDGLVRRVGETRSRLVDVRLFAATNEDLEVAVREGRFRQDLLARFGPFVIWVPPLRERRDEILPLANRFLAGVAGRRNHPDRYVMEPEVCRLLKKDPWPLNIRELQGVCLYAAEAARTTGHIGIPELPLEFLARAGPEARAEFDRSLSDRVREILVATGGNKSETARRARISRTHLYRLLSR